MTEQPNTISDKDWAKLQQGASDKAGGFIKTPEQKQAAETLAKIRDNANRN